MISAATRIVCVAVLFITGVFFPHVQSSGHSITPAPIQPGTTSAATQDDTVELTPSVPAMGSVPAPASGSCLLSQTQFTFVPNSPVMDIILTSDQNLDLYIRAGQRVAVEDGKIVADLSSVKPTGMESLTIENADLETTYFIAINNCSAEAASFTIAVFAVVVDPFPFITIFNCNLKRKPTGGFSLVISGNLIEEGATVTINGEFQKKVKFKPEDPINGSRNVVVKGKVCRFLPGIIVIFNPGGTVFSMPFTCNRSCPN